MRDINKTLGPLESLVPPHHLPGVPGQLHTGPPMGPVSVTWRELMFITPVRSSSGSRATEMKC